MCVALASGCSSPEDAGTEVMTDAAKEQFADVTSAMDRLDTSQEAVGETEVDAEGGGEADGSSDGYCEGGWSADAAVDLAALCEGGLTIAEYCLACSDPLVQQSYGNCFNVCGCAAPTLTSMFASDWESGCQYAHTMEAGCGMVAVFCHNEWDVWGYAFDATTGELVGLFRAGDSEQNYLCTGISIALEVGRRPGPECDCPCSSASECLAIAQNVTCVQGDAAADAP
jgi:hypothetical protein